MSVNLEYLIHCRRQFSDMGRHLFKSEPNFSEIERVATRLKNANELTRQDIVAVLEVARANWWFDNFWIFPVDRLPVKLAITFQQLTDSNERNVTKQLLDGIKHIELVSILLRFTRPDRYGILSPPVEQVLNVSRGSDAVETYLNYLGNLREIAREVPFESVADADMALWVLHEKCFGTILRDAEISELYENDPFMLGIRARNLVKPFQSLPVSKLAEALEGIRGDLASVVACYAFEVGIRAYARSEKTTWNAQYKLKQVIEDLHRRKKIDAATEKRWMNMKRVRDALFHGDDKPTPRQRQEMIQEVVGIEKRVPKFRIGEGL